MAENGNVHQISLKVEGVKRGQQLLNKQVVQVRVGEDGTYREAKNPSFDDALAWLQSEGYELAELASPKRTWGTVTVTYIYRKPQEQEQGQEPDPRDTALVHREQKNRCRDRLFKTT